MKKIKFEKKLSLNKETVANLTDDQMNRIKGGREISEQVCTITCNAAFTCAKGCTNTLA
jgi:natural product precursor